jgi:hypothetical protein
MPALAPVITLINAFLPLRRKHKRC